MKTPVAMKTQATFSSVIASIVVTLIMLSAMAVQLKMAAALITGINF